MPVNLAHVIQHLDLPWGQRNEYKNVWKENVKA